MKRDPKTDIPNFFNFAREYLHIYLSTVQRRSPKTIEAYRISLECFLDYLADHEHIERAQVSFDHFERQRSTDPFGGRWAGIVALKRRWLCHRWVASFEPACCAVGWARARCGGPDPEGF
jgi:hypothetical protein